MKALLSGIVVFVVLSSTAAFAAPKKKSFNYPPGQVFEAALQAAREHHVVSFVDEKHLMFTFETGKSMSSYGNKCDVGIDAKNGGTSAEMVINTQTKSEKQLFSWGAGGRLADDLFSWTEEKLKVGATTDTTSKPGATLMNSPATTVASPPPQSTRVSISSTPDGADIEVDGSFAGNTPSTLELAAGEHSISVEKTGFKPWEKKIKVGGGDIKINAEMERN